MPEDGVEGVIVTDDGNTERKVLGPNTLRDGRKTPEGATQGKLRYDQLASPPLQALTNGLAVLWQQLLGECDVSDENLRDSVIIFQKIGC